MTKLLLFWENYFSCSTSKEKSPWSHLCGAGVEGVDFSRYRTLIPLMNGYYLSVIHKLSEKNKNLSKNPSTHLYVRHLLLLHTHSRCAIVTVELSVFIQTFQTVFVPLRSLGSAPDYSLNDIIIPKSTTNPPQKCLL